MLLRVDLRTTQDFIPPKIETDGPAPFFTIDECRAMLAPGSTGKGFSQADVFTFFLDMSKDVTLGILASYLYDLIKNKHITEASIDHSVLPSKRDQIENALKEVRDANR